MNAKRIVSIAVFAALGLVVGYVFFGKIAGDYVSVNTLLSSGGNVFQKAFRSISGIEEMRNKILLCGGIGAMVGLLFPFKK